jgi:hypothetical protein
MRISIFLLALFTTPMAVAQQYLLPAAGNAPGANGTFFRSEVSMFSFREDGQRVAIRWLPQGRSAATTEDVIITVPSFGDGFFSENFVGDVLHRNELGAVLFTALKADGTPDPNSRLVVRSRIWTTHPAGGTMSQSFDAIPLSSINSTTSFAVAGLRLNTRFRLNAGVVNLDPANAHEFSMSVQRGGGSVTITVPPMSMVMTAVPIDSVVENAAQLVRIQPRTAPDPCRSCARRARATARADGGITADARTPSANERAKAPRAISTRPPVMPTTCAAEPRIREQRQEKSRTSARIPTGSADDS